MVNLVNYELRLDQKGGDCPGIPEEVLSKSIAGGLHKANRNCDCGLRGMEKNVSFKSKVINQLVSGDMFPRRILG